MLLNAAVSVLLCVHARLPCAPRPAMVGALHARAIAQQAAQKMDAIVTDTQPAGRNGEAATIAGEHVWTTGLAGPLAALTTALGGSTRSSIHRLRGGSVPPLTRVEEEFRHFASFLRRPTLGNDPGWVGTREFLRDDLLAGLLSLSGW